MGWNFRKSVKIAPGVKINLSKRGAGISVGPKVYKVSVNSKGDVYKTVSIPGTGLYKRERISKTTAEKKAQSHLHVEPATIKQEKQKSWLRFLRIPLWVVAAFFALVSISLFADGSIGTGIFSLVFPIGFFCVGLLCK